MGMVNELVGHKGVQQRFDGRIGRHRIEKIGALNRDHLFVGQCVARAQPAQRLEPHRRQPGRLDVAHVPARAFDAQNVDVIAHEVRDRGLDRRVAAAVQDKLGILPSSRVVVDP